MGNVVCECFEDKKPQKVPDEKSTLITKKDSRGTSKPSYVHSEPQSQSPTSPTKALVSKCSIKDAPPAPSASRVDSYQSKRYLGKGSFGSVVLVQRKNTPGDKLYAMKVIDKSQIRENNLLQSEVIEKVLNASQNDFLVRIIETFQNTKKVYIVMEYIEPGDLYYYMKKRVFTEDIIRGVVAEVIEAISFLHSKDIIYRDMKPENILVTTDGHIKITDFGLSRLEIDNKPTFTFAGNLQYMSPEVLEADNKGYGKMVDLWSLGILIYELKHCCTPFFRKDDDEGIRQRILNLEYSFRSDCSDELKDLVSKLLVKDWTARLSLAATRQHPFFKNINWTDVRQRKNQTPIKQIINQINIKFKGADEHHQRAFWNPAKDSYSPGLHEFTYDQEIVKP